MKPIPLNTETEILARRMVWFDPPEDALELPLGIWGDRLRLFLKKGPSNQLKLDRQVVYRSWSDRLVGGLRAARDLGPGTLHVGLVDPVGELVAAAQGG